MLASQISDNVVLTVTPKSESGLSIFKDISKLSVGTLEEFKPKDGVIGEIERKLIELGATIECKSEVGLTISMSKKLAQSLFAVEITEKRNRYIQHLERWNYSCSGDGSLPKLGMDDLIDEIQIPKGSFELSYPAPQLDRYHLRVPHDIAELSGVDRHNVDDLNGDGIDIVFIDSGLWIHPHFVKYGYNIDVEPAVSLLDPTRDERGHGTAMSSVFLSIAPKSKLTMIKMCCREMSFPVAAMQKAVSKQPDIINCSWGTIGFEPQLHLEIVNAISKDIQVVFAAGNGSTDDTRSMFQSIAVPEVITVGGVYINKFEGVEELSNISSSFESCIYQGRSVPDVCGPCGKMPHAHLILFPTEPGSDFDRRNGKNDGTKCDDGWLVSSGTSAAAAWVSGHIALLKQKNRSLSVNEQQKVLKSGAKMVACGVSSTGVVAEEKKPNSAAGYGLVSVDSVLKVE